MGLYGGSGEDCDQCKGKPQAPDLNAEDLNPYATGG